MSPGKGPDRRLDFEDSLASGPNDFDPEEDVAISAESGASEDESDFEIDEEAARDHYVDVEKSKLRRPEAAPLGPQYRGTKISRDAVNGYEDEYDPFGAEFEDEEGESEATALAKEDEVDGEDESEDEDQAEGTPDTEFSEIEQTNDTTAVVKDLMRDEAAGQRWLALSMSQAQNEEIEKGRAVKKQRAAFDSLIGTRMKLQKALIAINTVSSLHESEVANHRQEGSDAIEAAETAGFKLWSSLNQLRESLMDAKTGSKRKRSQLSPASTTDDLWTHMKQQDDECLSSRQAVLQKWSIKARATTTLTTRNKFNNSAQQATIIDVIQEQLSNSERLMKRSHTPRSCAPVQLANKVTMDDKIYDDADFYGLLLKEVLEQRSSDSITASNIDVSFGRMRREAKTKKNVDTKASKGRKLRYTVHEKLQNFMPPEDRSTWGERQTGELFASLFGQSVTLGEAEVEGEEEVVDAEEASLMLFRN